MDSILANKRLLIIIGVIILIIAVVALIIFGRQPQQTARPDTTQIDLVWRKPIYGDEVYQKIIEEFRSLPGNQYVNIKIDKVDYNNGTDYYKNLITDFARLRGPDIFSIRNDDLPAYKEFMTPITNVFNLTDSQILADYKTNFVNLAVRDTTELDKIYGVTSYVDNLQIYYNKDLLSQAGIPSPAKNWDDLDQHIPLLTNRNTSTLSFNQSAISLGTGLKKDNGDLIQDVNINKFQDILPVLVMQNGGQMFDYTKNTVTFGQDSAGNNPTMKALQFYLSFADQNSSRFSWDTNTKNNVDAFLEGKLAYIIHYRYFQDVIKQRNDRLRYGVSELPQLNQSQKKTLGFFFMDGLNRQLALNVERNPKDLVAAKKLQKAREFLYFLSSKSAQEKFVAATGLPGSRNDVVNKQLQGDENLRVFAAGTLYADNYYKADIDQVEKMWGQLLYRIDFENESPEESLQKAIQEYNLIIQKGPKLRI